MRTSAKGLLTILLAALAFPAYALYAAAPNRINLPDAELGYTVQDDDEEPTVTDRVARVSIVEGDAKVRRSGSDEWEKVTNNLPVVEGDEIVTSEDARLEIQFAKNQHARLDENSYLKLTGLKDEGIALSLSLGSLSVRVIDFDPSRGFFEIDAPKATIAIQRSGRYRIDAGREGDTEIRAAVTADGEARIYTESSGFTLRGDRTARIFVDGSRSGEYESADARGVSDDFEVWVAGREDFIARRLTSASFGKYYDDDIYGAEELDDYGEWMNTPEYGYVWRPNRIATAQYSDWSPYRYGSWRFMRPYGWVWVNDEPWGWATYHYGRWVYHRGNWVWAPYGYYRPNRSWWWPAYVSITIVNDNVCWYPLGYYRRRSHYNRDFETRKRERTGGPPTRRQIRTLPPGPTGTGKTERNEIVPPTGVVGVGRKEFGAGTRAVRSMPPTVAKDVLTKSEDTGLTGVSVPDRRTRQISPLAAERPKIDEAVRQIRTGAAPRDTEKALDEELRRTKIFGGRPPRTPPVITGDPGEPVRASDPVRSGEPRKTGIIDRPVRQTDPIKVEGDTRQTDPVKEDSAPAREKPRRIESPVRDQPPVYTPPAPERTRETREIRETPRYDPPPPRQTEKRSNDAPARSTPKNDPPPSKSEPKSDDKPAPPSRKEKPDNK